MKFVYDNGGRTKYFKKEIVGDCVTRAIVNATGMDYKEVYNMLKKESGKTPRNGVPKSAYRKVLQRLGWRFIPTMSIGSGCTTHMREEELPSGTIICCLSKHLTCVKNGVIYDTYDCSRNGTRCVYGYYVKVGE